MRSCHTLWRVLFLCCPLAGLLACTAPAPPPAAPTVAPTPTPVPVASRLAEAAPSRTIALLPIRDKQGQQVGLYSASYALVIGASAYVNWRKLDVLQDLREVTAVLREQDFQVEVVTDPTRDILQRAFEQFIARYGQEPDHRLLFYFAGHGYTLKSAYGEEMGYLVPIDAPLPDRDPAGFRTQALDMHQIENYALKIQSRHALFLLDSCFSGAVFALSRAVPENIQDTTSEPVRQFITPGSAKELVPDVSIFRQQLVVGLRGEADTDRDGYVTGTELGEFLQKQVVNYSRGAQHPQYGKLRHPQLDKGDVVFALARTSPPSVGPSLAEMQAQMEAQRQAVQAEQQRLEEARRLQEEQRQLHTAQVEAQRQAVQAEQQRLEEARRLQEEQRKLQEEQQRLQQERERLQSAAASTRPTAPGAAGGTQIAVGVPGAPAVTPLQTVRNSLGMELVLIPAGEFQMGSNNRNGDEEPAHSVRISRPFYLSKYEVTQGQWQAVMGSNPSWFTGEPTRPVERVSWDDIQIFLQQLNAREIGTGYRLPTEAEWEYAARAGTSTAYSFGNDAQKLGAYAWYLANATSSYTTHPVGQKAPNAWGLHDMLAMSWSGCRIGTHRMLQLLQWILWARHRAAPASCAAVRGTIVRRI